MTPQDKLELASLRHARQEILRMLENHDILDVFATIKAIQAIPLVLQATLPKKGCRTCGAEYGHTAYCSAQTPPEASTHD